MALLALLLLLGRGPVEADPTVAPPALKAAFLYNFAKFAEWPADAPSGPLTLCVIGDAAVADALEETTKGHTIGSRDIVVSRVKSGGLQGCHLLYVSGAEAKRSAQILDELKGAAVFTVGDRHEFPEAGGVAGFFVDGMKMRFAINIEAAQRARLRVSSRLLSLARLVKDNRVEH